MDRIIIGAVLLLLTLGIAVSLVDARYEDDECGLLAQDIAELERVEVAHDRVLLLGERLRVFVCLAVRPSRRRRVDGDSGKQTPQATFKSA